MKRIELKKGLDVPITGEPQQIIEGEVIVNKVAITGDDYIGMKPTMEVAEGDHVKTGQLLFRDKINTGVLFTSPATGKVHSINRGAKRKFETIIIDGEEDEFIEFLDPSATPAPEYEADTIRSILIKSGLWTSFRTRPYGKIPPIDSTPASLFITAMDSRPLAADPVVIIEANREEFNLGLRIIELLIESPKYICVTSIEMLKDIDLGKIEAAEFIGPHPAGLPSTHIHFLDPVMENRFAWHLDCQDVIAIGHLFRTGRLKTNRIVAISGPGVVEPTLVQTRIGADIQQICSGRIISSPVRILSGSVLDGRQVKDFHQFVGRYHNQISVLHEGSGRALFGWANPGGDRHSIKSAFTSALDRARKFAMNTALWGGKRAIYPIDSYHQVMPLDIEPLTLLKSISALNTDKASALGALELIEEDVALLSYVCPGKNDFAPMLRELLTEIEQGG